MVSVKIKITNLDQVRSAFSKAPELMKRELDIAVKKSILTIESQSKINTPVDTGRLRASTYARFSPLVGEVGVNTNYAGFVHEGTRFQKSQPFLRKAVESKQDIVNRFFTEAVNNVLSQIGRRT